MQWHVTWNIEVDTDTPEEAAREALAIQRDPESVAQVFDVIASTDPETGFSPAGTHGPGFDQYIRIDLMEMQQ